MTKALPVTVLTSLKVSTVWLIIEIVLWFKLGVGESDYYSWGPSDKMQLPFTNIIINTWSKWIMLVIHTIISVAIGVYSADMFYPWMSSVAINPGVALKHDRLQTFMAVNYFWLLEAIGRLIFFMVVYTQVDIAFISGLTACITGLFSSARVIYDDSRGSEELLPV